MTTALFESQAAQQLLAIARCPIMAECLDRDVPSHPCSAITHFQWDSIDSVTRIARWRGAHQVPEPWVGHIAAAPILFVSSNPSIRGQIAPGGLAAPTRDGITWDTSDDEIVDRFENAFDKYMVDGVRSIGAKRATRYWSSIKGRAQELIPHRPVRPGHDYALTEVVRCKSRSEVGVLDAAPTCIERYLTPTIELSAARVIVGIGAHARRALINHFLLASQNGVQRATVGERERLVVFLPHPNARGGSKSLAGNLRPADLDLLRSRLNEKRTATGEIPAGDSK
jgi:hypothetical protein